MNFPSAGGGGETLPELLDLTTPEAVANYTTVGAGATWDDLDGPLPGYTGTAALANATNLQGKTCTIAAGDFAMKYWEMDFNCPFAATVEYGLIFNAGAAAQMVMSLYRGTNLPQLTFSKYTNVTTYGAPATINGGAFDQVVDTPWGVRTGFGVSRTGSTLTYYLRINGGAWRTIGTSNDTTDIGLAASPTKIGPMFHPNAAVITGTAILHVVSSPAA